MDEACPSKSGSVIVCSRGSCCSEKHVEEGWRSSARDLMASVSCSEAAGSLLRTASVNRRRKRLENMLVQLGEFSSARQALDGAELVPRTQTSLNALKDPSKRAPVPRDPSRDFSDFIRAREFVRGAQVRAEFAFQSQGRCFLDHQSFCGC